MHTICCEQFESIKYFSVKSGEVFRKDFLGYENVPCIVECRFDCASPIIGNMYVGTVLYDLQKSRPGNLKTVRSFAEVALDIKAVGSSGFSVEIPQGIGRGLIIYNDLNVNITDCFVSIKYMFNLVEALASAKKGV